MSSVSASTWETCFFCGSDTDWPEPFTEIVVWDNSKRPDLSVYGRYAAIEECKNDIIFTMDDDQKRSLDARFPGNVAVADVICLDIPDRYLFLEPELVRLLEERAGPHIERMLAAGR